MSFQREEAKFKLDAEGKPLSVYFKNAKVKVEVGLCKGKKNYDKRDATAKRDAAREMDRAMKARR